jgi:hypothetical protein
MSRSDREENVRRLTEILRRFVPDVPMSDHALINKTITEYRKSYKSNEDDR